MAGHHSGDDPDGEGGVQVRLVDHAEIKENGWDLNLGRYVKAAAAKGMNVATALAGLAKAQEALGHAEEELAERLKAAGLRDGWWRVLLSEVARVDCDRVPVEPESRYEMAGVLNAGQGLFVRERIAGSETNYAFLHRPMRDSL